VPRPGEVAHYSGNLFQGGGEVFGDPVGFSEEEMDPMNPKDGPGLSDVLVTIFSQLIVMMVVAISIMGYFLLAPWGRE
jgi:hypothetical protein